MFLKKFLGIQEFGQALAGTGDSGLLSVPVGADQIFRGTHVLQAIVHPCLQVLRSYKVFFMKFLYVVLVLG